MSEGRRYEYQVCQVQDQWATFVNGAWLGTLPMEGADPQVALSSCPSVWDYLNKVGNAGWESCGRGSSRAVAACCPSWPTTWN